MAWDSSGTQQTDRAVGDARTRNDFAAIDAALEGLVDAAAAGDLAARDELLRLIDRHRLALGAIRKMLIDEGDVEDAMQSTLLAVSRGITSFEPRSRFTTWRYRIAEREPRQVLPRHKRVPLPGGEHHSAPPHRAPQPTLQRAASATVRTVLRVRRALPVRARAR